MAELREVDGFLFSDEDSYKAAQKEAKAVEYLKKQLSGKDGTAILKIYNQLLEQNIFHTQVGYTFLHDIYVALRRQTKIADSVIPPIKVDSVAKKEAAPVQEKQEEKPPKVIVKTIGGASAKQNKYLKIVVAVLVVVVIGMFAITLTSQSPTILDYETKLQNKYASWEQQLTEREAQIKLKEAQLNMD